MGRIDPGRRPSREGRRADRSARPRSRRRRPSSPGRSSRQNDTRRRRRPPARRHVAGAAVRQRLRSRGRRHPASPAASTPMPVWLLAAEVLATILGLFLFGSFRYQIHKNALTYGMLLVIVATFSGLPTSTWHVEIAQQRLGRVDPAAPAVVRRPRRSDPRRHDAVHPRPDAVRLGHRADAAARRHHVLPAPAQPGPDSADRHRR